MALLAHRCCMHWGVLGDEAAHESDSAVLDANAALLHSLIAVISSHSSEEGREGATGENSGPDGSLSRLAYW